VSEKVFEHCVCLGCGCACDDIAVAVQDDRIIRADQACALGLGWFDDGQVPFAARVANVASAVPAALDRAAALLKAAKSPLIYLAGDLTIEAYRAAIAIADRLGGRLDNVTSDTVAAGVIAGQTRGRSAATLGELLNRADVLVFWGTDPATRYPRFGSRYAIDPHGLQTPEGRRSRTVVAVDVGRSRGPTDADLRISLEPGTESAAIGLLRRAIANRAPGTVAPALQPLLELATRLRAARYAVVVADGEPSDLPSDPTRAEALIALTQALNGPTRAVLTTLRSGNNRSGAEAVMLWQCGFPLAIDFGRGFPRYAPLESAAAMLGTERVDVVLIVGSTSTLPESVVASLARAGVVLIGPRATAAPFSVKVAIDTGIAGIHDSGTAYRMDDVPMPLRAVLPGATSARSLLEELLGKLGPRERAR
jgi:formylmethanofuran dehydrogenase subunit B